MAKTESTRKHLYRIIFEADTPGGKLFDVCLLWAIFISVTAVILESVSVIDERYGFYLKLLEWFFTIVFTFEYFLRLYSSPNAFRYAFSFFGLVDILSILPSYVGLFGGGIQSLMVIRGLRLLRIFRILKLGRFLAEADQLMSALAASRRKIAVFIGAVMMIVTIMGTLMYLIEGEENGFTSIPRGIYWAIVTMTTVGYGDISPNTALGQALASIIMILGYGIIAVPTGIVSAELSRASRQIPSESRVCSSCLQSGHQEDAQYCRRCGAEL